MGQKAKVHKISWDYMAIRLANKEGYVLVEFYDDKNLYYVPVIYGNAYATPSKDEAINHAMIFGKPWKKSMSDHRPANLREIKNWVYGKI